MNPTYNSDGEDSDDSKTLECPSSLHSFGSPGDEGRYRQAPPKRTQSRSHHMADATEVVDYFELDEEEDVPPDLLARQVIARKMNAASPIAKLICDEVDGSVPDAAKAAGLGELGELSDVSPDVILRALSRGKSTGAIRPGRGMARSKSQFGARARSRSTARGLTEPGALDAMMRDGEATRGFVRRRPGNEPPHAYNNGKSGEELKVARGGATESGGGRRTRADVLNRLAVAEDSEGDGPARRQSIRFA
jgi:hypothetical protein